MSSAARVALTDVWTACPSKRTREQLVQRRDDRVALGSKGANVLAKLLIGNGDDFERVKDDADVLDLV